MRLSLIAPLMVVLGAAGCVVHTQYVQPTEFKTPSPVSSPSVVLRMNPSLRIAVDYYAIGVGNLFKEAFAQAGYTVLNDSDTVIILDLDRRRDRRFGSIVTSVICTFTFGVFPGFHRAEQVFTATVGDSRVAIVSSYDEIVWLPFLPLSPYNAKVLRDYYMVNAKVLIVKLQEAGLIQIPR